MEQIRSADVLANFPQVDEEKLNAALTAEAAASNRKIIVLDDDPTGVQTVHDIYVYTDWTVESLRKGFAAPEKLFFILTNSRGFTVAETTKAHREIAENTAKVAREFGMDYLIISRGDSTLRGLSMQVQEMHPVRTIIPFIICGTIFLPKIPFST